MAYKVYRKVKGSDSVEVLDDTVYETKAEAEIAMLEAKNSLKHSDIPFPTKVGGTNQPGTLNTPGTLDEEIVAIPKDDDVNEDDVEFFIREV